MVTFRRLHGLAAALGLFTCIGCSSPAAPTVPPPPTPDPPVIACPVVAPQTSPNGQAVAVTFVPTVSLGAPPVETICTPPSGSAFTVGTTGVTCTATDARQRTASCSFDVVVLPPPRLMRSRFVAFGDSITVGEDGNSAPTAGIANLLGLQYPTVVLRGREYPTVLQQLLSARYATQSIVVVNAGCSAEFAGGASPCAAGGSFSRFTSITSSRQHDVVLLMEGTNDIFGGTGGNPLGIPPAIAGLRLMIRDARSRGISVLLATVPPGNPAGRRGLERYQAIPLLNDQIRQLAAAEGVPLVDVFGAFNNDFSYLGSDGTHPNAAGFSLIASTFFDAIRGALEERPPTVGSSRAFEVITPDGEPRRME